MLKCPNCGKNVYEKKISDFNIYICKSCGACFLDEQYEQTCPEVPDDVYAESLSYLNDIRIANNKTNLKHIRHYFGPKEITGLEIGSATGVFMEMAEKQGVSMMGIEPMKRSCEIARGKGLKVICGIFPDDLSQTEKYDFIIFNDVFEHIRDSEKVLLDCKSHMKKSGLLIINLPMRSGVIYMMSSLINQLGDGTLLRRLWQVDTSSPHVVYYNQRSIHYITRKVGFRPLYQKGVRMKTYTAKSLKDRINAFSIGGTLRKNALLIAGTVGSPFAQILPADLTTFYFTIKDE